MVESNNAINNTVGAEITGVTNTLTVTNPSDTASSAARASISVGGASSADPTLNFNVAGVTDWEMGIDNNDSDKLKISQGTALGTNDTWIMTTAGERTMPLQPAFRAFLGSTISNVTGDGTLFRLGDGTPLTKVFDQNSDLNTNGIFTAPVTGIYTFYATIILNNVGASHSNAEFYFNFSTVGNVLIYKINPSVVFASRGGISYSMVRGMTAGDTSEVRFGVSGGSKTVGIAAPEGSFSGILIA